MHVPSTPQTKNMIGEEQIKLMRRGIARLAWWVVVSLCVRSTDRMFYAWRPGSFLLNASRGSVVIIPDLVKALKSGHLVRRLPLESVELNNHSMAHG